MSRFDRDSWLHAEIHPESVPHILHQDLTYLWILEKQLSWRPEGWKDRIDAWGYLISLFLLGELKATEEIIGPPLDRYAGQSIKDFKLTWLSLRSTNERVGVMSPTVLVRPLPDFNPKNLGDWRRVIGDPREKRPDELSAYTRWACDNLRRSNKEAPKRLAEILEREFPAGQGTGGRTAQIPGRARDVQLIETFGWTHPTFCTVQILVRAADEVGLHRPYVPKCERCNEILTRLVADPPISVESDQITLPCTKPGCAALNRIPVSRFLLWLRDDRRAVVWKRDGFVVPQDFDMPPNPDVRGHHLDYTWDQAALDGVMDKCCLTLDLKNRAPEMRSAEEVFFKNILVMGAVVSGEDLKGIPISAGWLDAIQEAGPAEITANRGEITDVVFRGLRLKGTPSAVKWTYHRTNIHHAPETGAGIYPDPNDVPAGWKWYRLFAESPAKVEVKVQFPGGVEILPWVTESNAGVPESVTFTLANDRDLTGISYLLQRPQDMHGRADGNVLVGIDFGTTHTLVYHRTVGPTADQVRADVCAIKPGMLADGIRWLASPRERIDECVASFLPGSDIRLPQQGRDACLFPSAVHTVRGAHFIRWASEALLPDQQRALTNFKLDRGGQDLTAARWGYLKEVLLLTLPAVLRTLKREGAPNAGRLELGIAFPLAMNLRERESYTHTLTEVLRELRGLTGLETSTPFSISESAACVMALGRLDVGETCLVADMGGGTLDFALFTQRPENLEFHQLGSLRFAGECFIEAVARRKGGAFDETAWDLRDALTTHQGLDHYRNDQDVQVVLNRVVCLAFEYIRTLVAAHFHSRDESTQTSVKLLLVGNGWSLPAAFDPRTDTLGEGQVLKRYYADLIGRLGLPGFELLWPASFDDRAKLPTSKHLVVQGALRNTFAGKKARELESAHPSKLPAGRGIVFGEARGVSVTLHWWDLIGDGAEIAGNPSTEELQGGGLRFEFTDMPEIGTDWKIRLQEVFRIPDGGQPPYPDQQILREEFLHGVSGRPASITKGPLQIVLETTWKEGLPN